MSGAAVIAHRHTKWQQIEQFFRENPGRRFSSADLHARFGSAFRTRVSEINRSSESAIVIHNRVVFGDDAEQSVYWAERRPSGGSPVQVPMFAAPTPQCWHDPEEGGLR